MNPGRFAIAAGCVYELVALSTGRVPTITAIVKGIGRARMGRVVLWLWLGAVVDHFAER